jgi:hypothetical protein
MYSLQEYTRPLPQSPEPIIMAETGGGVLGRAGVFRASDRQATPST